MCLCCRSHLIIQSSKMGMKKLLFYFSILSLFLLAGNSFAQDANCDDISKRKVVTILFNLKDIKTEKEINLAKRILMRIPGATSVTISPESKDVVFVMKGRNAACEAEIREMLREKKLKMYDFRYSNLDIEKNCEEDSE